MRAPTIFGRAWISGASVMFVISGADHVADRLVFKKVRAAFGGNLKFAVTGAAPLPPGGDPGQWLSNSYPYVGLPYPSQVIPWGYPPGLFPVLGSLVLLGGDPILGARLYLGVAAVLPSELQG